MAAGQNMKINLQEVALGLGLLGMALCTGCETSRANAEPADSVQVLTNATPPPATTSANPKGAPTGTAPVAAATNVPVVQAATLPQQLNLSPALGQVVKLIQGGVSHDVILTYITNSTDLFNLGSNEILYLNDLGTPPTLITALIQKDSSPESQAKRQALGAALPLPPGLASNTPVPNVYPASYPVADPPEPIPVAPPDGAQTVIVTNVVVEQPVTVSYFESELSPYGSWVYVNGYGHCWRPTVAVCNTEWRPYSDCGRWMWTDSGWYWYSDYSWGWAPFHYGRWFCPSGVGWVWYPDTCWGPAWVSWR